MDLATAQQEKNKHTERAAKAEGEVSKLRAAINASGSENLRRIVELQDEVQRKNDILDDRTGLFDRLLDIHRALQRDFDAVLEHSKRLREKYDWVLATGQRIQAGRDEYLGLWTQAIQRREQERQRRVDAELADRRNKMYLERARKSRGKAQRRLYALRAQVRRAEKKRKQR